MNQNKLKTYWKPVFETFYETYFQELASEALVSRWERIDVGTAYIVAITASGSAISGWTLWSEPGWRVVWVIIAGVASLTSILHRVLGVPRRLKEQEDLYRKFSALRIDIETFRQQLSFNMQKIEIEKVYGCLRERLSECMSRTHPEIAFTKRLRKRVQNKLNSMMKVKGYIQ